MMRWESPPSPIEAKLSLSGFFLEYVDQLGQRPDRHVLVEDHDLLAEEAVGDRLEILERIVRELAVDLGIDRDRAAGQQAERVAVRRGALAGVGGDDGVGARRGSRPRRWRRCGPRTPCRAPRTNTSMAPPGGSGTMIWTGRDGYLACASAAGADRHSIAATPANANDKPSAESSASSPSWALPTRSFLTVPPCPDFLAQASRRRVLRCDRMTRHRQAEGDRAAPVRPSRSRRASNSISSARGCGPRSRRGWRRRTAPP